MLELILVRHGETDSNVKGTYLGWTDVKLNQKGLMQARSAAQKLKDIKADAIYASPLKRAMKTAEIINENLGIEIISMDSLKERNFGVWDDLSREEIMEKYQDQYELYAKDWINYCVEGGESSMQAYHRITKFVDDLVQRKDEGTFILVTHLGCVRKIIAHLLGLTIEGSWRFRVENCGIARIQINDEKYAYLTALNA